jgi:hypothetical protein
MVSLPQLLSLDLNGLHDVADDWEWIAWRLRQLGGEIDGSVVQPIKAGNKWSGDDARKAADTLNGVHMDMSAVAKEAEAVGKFLDDVATGAGDGFGSLKKYQDRARELSGQAMRHGFQVQDDGTVTWAVIRASGPLTPAEQKQLNAMNATAGSIETELKKVLKSATEIDATMAYALKVIFGEKDTFRTEDRNRHTGGRNFETSWIENKLVLVVAALRAHGWSDAADLLKHYLDNSGEPMTVDADRMLKDIPQFQKDVSTTLAGIKNQPDGSFQTNWQDSAPNLGDGGKNENWYYGINDFKYRVVGQKHDGQIDYHIEVKKRYDWGVPSEHHRDLDRYFLHFEQADIARLNMVGEAKDFDITGKTETKTIK